MGEIGEGIGRTRSEDIERKEYREKRAKEDAVTAERAASALIDFRNRLKSEGTEEEVVARGVDSLIYAQQVARSPHVRRFLGRMRSRVDIGGIKLEGYYSESSSGEFTPGERVPVVFRDPYEPRTLEKGFSDRKPLQPREVYKYLELRAEIERLFDNRHEKEQIIPNLSKLTRGQILDSFEKAISLPKSP